MVMKAGKFCIYKYKTLLIINVNLSIKLLYFNIFQWKIFHPEILNKEKYLHLNVRQVEQISTAGIAHIVIPTFSEFWIQHTIIFVCKLSYPTFNPGNCAQYEHQFIPIKTSPTILKPCSNDTRTNTTIVNVIQNCLQYRLVPVNIIFAVKHL